MVTNPENLKDLIASDIFMAVSGEVCKRTSSILFPMYNDVLFEATRNQHQKSDISIDELYALISHDSDEFVRYVCASILDSRGAAIEQEYPPSETPDEADAWVVRKELGVSKDFIVPHLIDYWFLVKKPDGLEAYLKATRTPNAKRQAKRLMQLLKTVSSPRLGRE